MCPTSYALDWRRSTMIWVAVLSFLGGCGQTRLEVAPVQGRVSYRGKALEFGSVQFQPTAGPPARGVIQSDGSFRLSTYQTDDGAVIGQHVVRIACFESQRPATNPAKRNGIEPGVGRSLIPAQYANFDSSGFQVEVKADNEPFAFDLSD